MGYESFPHSSFYIFDPEFLIHLPTYMNYEPLSGPIKINP